MGRTSSATRSAGRRPVQVNERRRRSPSRSTLRLALWCLRHTWGLLAITALGLVACVTIACTGPLYSSVAMTAGLRTALTSSRQNTDIVIQGSAQQISSATLQRATALLNQEMIHATGSYLDVARLSVETPSPLPSTRQRARSATIWYSSSVSRQSNCPPTPGWRLDTCQAALPQPPAPLSRVPWRQR